MALEKQTKWMKVVIILSLIAMAIIAAFTSCKPIQQSVLCNRAIEIESILPGDSDSGIPLSTKIVIRLKERPSPEVAQMLCTEVIPVKGKKCLRGDISFDGDRTATITFKRHLKKDSVYQVYIYLQNDNGEQQYLTTSYFSTRW